jgi:hypothetical protein
MFSDEVAIRGAAADGSEFSLFAPEECVEYDAASLSNDWVDGLLSVKVLDAKGGLRLIELPAEPFEVGRFIAVQDSQIEQRCQRQRV